VRVRKVLDELLAAPGLTPRRFALFAAVSLTSTAVVLAAAPTRHAAPWDLVAAARQRPAPVVKVTPAPKPVVQASTAAPVVDASVKPASDAAVAQVSEPSAPAVAARPVPVTAPAKDPQPTTTTTPVPPKPASKVKHVFLVDVAGSDTGAGTYFNDSLRPQGRLLEGYKPLATGALATEVALVSGQKATPGIEQGCPTYGGDCVFPVETLTLADQLLSAGKRWRGYFDAMPSACTHPDLNAAEQPSTDYVTNENPFVYFRSLTELGECQSNDVPLDGLSDDLATADATPNFVYVAAKPSETADDFLAGWVPKILDSPAYKADGLLIVVTDDGALLVSQFATPGSSSQTAYGAYGVLRSIEDLFGLGYLGSAGDSSATSFAKTEVAAGLP
jgi:phosphatidylinositol-3-phosphatase